jgi:phenylpyruvate tautomerase PptA (4-oxalocrotonate tautomerase family)
MPIIKIQTNKVLSRDQANELLAVTSRKGSEWLNKPEAYVQVLLEAPTAMMFAGSIDPSILIEVRSLGFSGHSISEISRSLCILIHAQLNIPEDRIFINFFDIERSNWGWNGKTFA